MNGLLVIDKPGGMTSHDVVNRLRRITGERSIGHLGTLDPMATGVLPLLMGKFTRLAQYFSAAEKSYTRSDPLRIRDRHLRRRGRARGTGPLAGICRSASHWNRCARRPRDSTARSSRCRRRFPPRRSTASRPTSWRAKASRWS